MTRTDGEANPSLLSATGTSPLRSEDVLLGTSLRTRSSASSAEVVIAHAEDRRQEGLILTTWVTIMSFTFPGGQEAARMTNVAALSRSVTG